MKAVRSILNFAEKVSSLCNNVGYKKHTDVFYLPNLFKFELMRKHHISLMVLFDVIKQNGF